MMKFLVLTDDDVKKSLPMKEAVDAMARAFQDLTEGRAQVPVRCTVATEKGFTAFMPGSISGANEVLGLKIVSIRPNNPKNHNLPTIPGQVYLVDPETSQPLVLMDATYLTWLRTAAGSATRYLARKDVKKLAVFGAGNQGRSHIEAMVTERPSIKEIVILNRTHNKAEELARELRQEERYKEIDIRASKDSKEALKGALLVVTCTGSHEPLFDGNRLEKGAHVNAIGSHLAHVREVDTVTIKRSKVVVDELKAAMVEAGDILVPIKEGAITKDHVLAELGQVVSGKQIRTSDDDITFFKSVGIAAQDVSAGLAVYKRAVALGLGITVDTDKRSKL